MLVVTAIKHAIAKPLQKRSNDVSVLNMITKEAKGLNDLFG